MKVFTKSDGGNAMTAPDSAVRPAAQTPQARNDADVIVVGAGPSGSSAAYWLATAGP